LICPFSRGIVIVTNITALIGTLLGGFAIYVDQSGIDPLLHSNPTYKYCAQSFAATFIFDIVVCTMSLVMFLTTFLSLVFPSIFQEIDIDKYRRERQEIEIVANDEKNKNSHVSEESPRVEYSKNSVYEQKQDSFRNPNPQQQQQYNSRIIHDSIA
jgi:hypothetical protein